MCFVSTPVSTNRFHCPYAYKRTRRRVQLLPVIRSLHGYKTRNDTNDRSRLHLPKMCTTRFVVLKCAKCWIELARRRNDGLISCEYRRAADPDCPRKEIKHRVFTKLCFRCSAVCNCWADFQLSAIGDLGAESAVTSTVVEDGIESECNCAREYNAQAQTEEV